jgi:uncharacterized protein (TIRG00374 family)
MNRRVSRSRNWIFYLVAMLFVAIGIAIIAANWKDVKEVLLRANWSMIIPALFFTAASYLFLSYGLAAVFTIFKVKLSTRDMLEIGFVSNALNYLISMGGMIGISIRFALMKRRGISTEDILAPSTFHSYFNNLALMALLPVGLINVFIFLPLSAGGRLGIAVGAVVLLVLLVLATLLVFISQWRQIMLNAVGQIVLKLLHKNIGGALYEFNQTLDKGITNIRQRPVALVWPVLCIIGDWACSLLALWFGFLALGTTIGAGTLITGFGVGVTAGLLSFIPGGFGVQEGSMSAIYAAMGVPLEEAVLAAVLFRVIYYFIPFGVSLFFYRRLLSEKP